MAFRTWGRPLLTALGASLLAGAGQLGIAFGFGVVRLTGSFTGGTVNQWPAQLAWVGWFAANAAVVGAVLTERLARRDGPLTGTGRQLAVAGAAALGATIVAPLCMQPARAADLISVDPVWAVAICATLGAVVGAGAALAVLVRPPLGWNMAIFAGAVWLLALVSVAPSLAATGPLTTVRLGVLEPSGLDATVTQRLALLVLPLVALVTGAVTGALARWHGQPPLIGGLTGVTGPVLVAFAYLTAGPGDGVDRYQATPYYGALLAVAAGALGSAAAALLRWPLVERPAGSTDSDRDRAIEPTDILRPLPAGPALPATGTSAAPTGPGDRAGPAASVTALDSPIGEPPATTAAAPVAAAGSGSADVDSAAGAPSASGAPSRGYVGPAHWDWPAPGGTRSERRSDPAGGVAPVGPGNRAEAAAPDGTGTAPGGAGLTTPPGDAALSPPRGDAALSPPRGDAVNTTAGDGARATGTPDHASRTPGDAGNTAEPGGTGTPATPPVGSAAGQPTPRPRRTRRAKATPAKAAGSTAPGPEPATASAAAAVEPAAEDAAGRPAEAPSGRATSDSGSTPDTADSASDGPTERPGPRGSVPGDPAPDTADDRTRQDPTPVASTGSPAPPRSTPTHDPAPAASTGPPAPRSTPTHDPAPAASTGPPTPPRSAPTPATPARPSPTPVGPGASTADPVPVTPPRPTPSRLGPEPFPVFPPAPTPMTPAPPAPRPAASDPFSAPTSPSTEGPARDATPRPRHRAALPDLTSPGTWNAFGTVHRTGPADARPADVRFSGTGADADGGATNAPEAGTADRRSEPGVTEPTATDGTAAVPPNGQASGGKAAATEPRRRGLFRRSRSRAGEAEGAAETEQLPAQDEEFVDWVAGLAKPLPDNEPEQESGRRSLRSTGRHHAD
ncbi:hypothetical protein [Micromonospora sp. NPDC126480]|uniref:hypothetical protein n=1 Tax=Micromonospora sp. NPDC126480 TaxID=3155312 RepID=UPI00331707EF